MSPELGSARGEGGAGRPGVQVWRGDHHGWDVRGVSRAGGVGMILTETDIHKLLIRYNGIGKPLTSDERELLIFALYNESESRGGLAASAKRECDSIWRKQQIVKPV